MLKDADSGRKATLGYIAPFLAFVGIMTVARVIPLPPAWLYAIRFFVVLILICILSRPYLSLRPTYPVASIGIGIAVFVVWVAPDLSLDTGITGCSKSSCLP